MTRVLWAPQAIQDVEAIRAHVARDSARYADLVVERIVPARERAASEGTPREACPAESPRRGNALRPGEVARAGLVFEPIAALSLGKYLAVRGSRWFFAALRPHARLVWSLALSQMAATLPAAVVAHNTANTAGERLLGNAYVNAALVVLICVAGLILIERFARGYEAADSASRASGRADNYLYPLPASRIVRYPRCHIP